MSGRCRRRRRVLRNRKRHPGIPARGPVLGGEFLVSLDVEEALHGAYREDESDLRPDGRHLRLEAADVISRAAVAADLLVDIADETDKGLLAQELRGGPVE